MKKKILFTAKTPINDSDLAFGSLGHLWSFGGRIGYDRTASGELVWKPKISRFMGVILWKKCSTYLM